MTELFNDTMTVYVMTDGKKERRDYSVKVKGTGEPGEWSAYVYLEGTLSPMFVSTPQSSDFAVKAAEDWLEEHFRKICLLYTSPSPRDGLLSRMPSSA